VIVVLVAALIAAVTDVWKFKVYNTLTLPLLVSGLIYHTIIGGSQGLASSVTGLLCGFAILFFLYLLGGMGAGDVKLMAAIGAWMGMPLTYYIFVASSLAAGVYAIILLVMSRTLGDTWVNFQILWIRLATMGRHLGNDERFEGEIKRSDRRRRMVPFAAMVAIGLIGTYLWLWANPS